jgi:hypothetical protein
MAFSLADEKPTVAINGGRTVLGDPAGSTEASIWMSASAVAVLLLVVGAAASLVPTRFAVAGPAVAAVGLVVALQLPLDGWESRHSARFPQGVDLIRDGSRFDLILRGEWEANARHTANQLSFWAVAIAVSAILVAVLLEVRRRRGPTSPPVAPPPEAVGGTPT